MHRSILHIARPPQLVLPLLLSSMLLGTIPPLRAASASERASIPQDVLAEVLKKQANIAFVGERTRTRFYRDPEREDVTSRQKVYHGPPDAYRVDYLDLPEGREQHFLAKGDHLYVWRSRERVDMRERNPDDTLGLVIPLTYLDLLRENYRIKAEEGDEVADRPTYSVHITPKVEGRPSLRAWVDRTYGVPLKVELYDYKGDLELRFEYSTITFRKSLSAEYFQFPEGAEIRAPSREGYYATPEELAEKTGLLTPIADRPLSGFRLTAIRHIRREGTDRVQSFYSDGYASLSIFAVQDSEKAPPGVDEPGVRSITSERRRGYAIIRGWLGEVQITIMSRELPESRLIFMLPTIRLTDTTPKRRR